MRSNYVERAKRFVQEVYPYICDCDNLDVILRNICQYNMKKHRKVRVCHGATRIVLCTSDYVVKINYGCDLYMFGGCEEEFNLYCEAEAAGFAYLLAKPTPFHYQGETFWIMPLIHGIERYDDDVWPFLTDEEFKWLDRRVQDIHSQNYGWFKGRPIIFDYACLRGENWFETDVRSDD